MLFYLSSNDSKTTHTANTAFDFIVELPDLLHFEGKWVCRLLQCTQPTSKKGILLVDCLDYSYIRGTSKPVLRIIDESDQDFYPLIDVPLKINAFNCFHIQILDFTTLKVPAASADDETSLLIELKKV